MEPPDLAAPTVPGQPAGGHDHAAAPAFSAPPGPFPPGTASVPPAPGHFPPGAGPFPPGPGAPWQPLSPPAKRGGGAKVGLIVVSVGAVLLLGLSGVTGYLWWSTANELSDTRAELTAEVADLTETLAARDSEIGRLGDDLQAVQDELSDAETQLAGTENMVELLEEQQEVIRQCILLVGEVNDALDDDDVRRASRLMDEAEEVCAEADDILGF